MIVNRETQETVAEVPQGHRDDLLFLAVLERSGAVEPMGMVADRATVTEADLVEDLGRLLREGLVAVVVDDADDDPIPRFQVTPRGQQECQHEGVTGEVTS